MQDFFANLSKKQKIIIIITMFLVILIIFIFLYRYFYSNDEIIETDNNIISETVENQPNNQIGEIYENSKIGIQVQKNKVIVHIIGEVNNPGVVTLDEGARIIDAINAAGGKTEEADLSKINLAYVIEDGIQIYIPRINDSNLKNINENNNKNTEKNYEENFKSSTDEVMYVRDDAGDGIITETASKENKETVKININTATKEKLQTLSGIGESTAQKIIEYREKNGKFKSIDDIKNVSGIGESKFNSLKDSITV